MDKRRGLRYHIEVVDYAARSEVISLNLMKKELQQFLHVTLFFFPHHCPTFKIDDFVKSRNQTAKKKIQMQGARIARSEAYMEPHSQACGIACYAPTGDILSEEHSPTAKPVMLCVEGEKYTAVIYPVKYFLCLMLLFSSTFSIPYLLDMAVFNLTGQGMQRNASGPIKAGSPSVHHLILKSDQKHQWI